MKAMRYALTALLCYGAFWGAAHIGFLPGLHRITGVAPQAEVRPSADMPQSMTRLLPITLR